MEKTYPDQPDFPVYLHNNPDQTLDEAQLETRCPLDNGRHTDVSIPPRCSVGQLDQLPAELLIQVLRYVDVPSLTGFRSVNRRAMELVDSVPQYAAIIKHCPNVIRAIISIQASAFSLDALYRTLGTTRCSTCDNFGDRLYLIDCSRVCFICLTQRSEYFPLVIECALRYIEPGYPFSTPHPVATDSHQRLLAANPPSILTLPGRYCSTAEEGGLEVSKRFRLFDRRAVMQGRALPAFKSYVNTINQPLRFMAVITAPYLFDFGRKADWGSFCLGCKDDWIAWDGRHYKTKYTREGVLEHMTRFGPLARVPHAPEYFAHVPQS